MCHVPFSLLTSPTERVFEGMNHGFAFTDGGLADAFKVAAMIYNMFSCHIQQEVNVVISTK